MRDLKTTGIYLVLRRDHKFAHSVRRELSLQPENDQSGKKIKDARDVQLATPFVNLSQLIMQ